MRLEELGLVGNCRFAALVDAGGDAVWCCLPRFDSEPVFARLLDAEDGGGFRIGPAPRESIVAAPSQPWGTRKWITDELPDGTAAPSGTLTWAEAGRATTSVAMAAESTAPARSVERE